MTMHHNDDDSLGSPTSPLSPVNTITQDNFSHTRSTHRIHSSPERYRSDGHMSTLNRVPEDGAIEFDNGRVPVEAVGDEDEEWDVDEELETQGLYRGSYRTLVLLYSFAPLTSLLGLIVFAILPIVLSPADETQHPYPYTHLIPFPIPELLVSVSLYSFAHILRHPIYSVSQTLLSWFYSLFSSSWQTSHPNLSDAFIIIVSAVMHTFLSAGLRIAAFPILLIIDITPPSLMSSPSVDIHDPPSYSSFFRVWWVALGWAFIEAVIGIIQGYEGIALYKEVLVDVDEDGKPKKRRRDVEEGEHRGRTPSNGVDDNGKGKGRFANMYGTFGSQSQEQAPPPTQTRPTTQSQNQNQNQNQTSPRLLPISRSISEGSQNQKGLPNQNLENVHEPSSTASGLEETEPLLGSVASISRIGLGSRDGRRSDIELPYLSNLSLSALSVGHPLDSENLEQSLELQVNQDLDELMLIRARDELENTYGVAFVKIPVFISCLQRVNSLLLSVGVTLLLGMAYLGLASSSRDVDDYDYIRLLNAFHSPMPSISLMHASSSSAVDLISLSSSMSEASSPSPFPSPTTILIPTFILLIVLSLLHTPLLLPRMGVHTVVYIGALLSLGAFFAGLGVWGVLV